jgi:hypothetical protein
LGFDYPKEERIVGEGEAVRMSGRGGVRSPEIVRITGGRRLGFRSPEESHPYPNKLAFQFRKFFTLKNCLDLKFIDI